MEKSAGGSLSAGLPALFPWLKLDASATAEKTRPAGRQDDQTIVLEPIERAARQLVQLSLHYLVNQRDRARKAAKAIEEVIGDGGRPRWIDYRMKFSRAKCSTSMWMRTETTTLASSPTTCSGAANGTGSGSSAA